MNGLLVLDKPSGMTSHDVVAIVRRATGEKSIGHLGTLDPMATGVLQLLLGKYTRLAQFFGQAEKTYTGSIRFGFATDTFDAEGEAAGEPVALSKTLNELKSFAAHFRGTMDQVPPVYSAKKINGVPAHKLARAGLEAPVKAARITIHEFVLTDLSGDTARFAMRISAGGYVRSVAHELGQMAGSGARASVFAAEDAGWAVYVGSCVDGGADEDALANGDRSEAPAPKDAAAGDAFGDGGRSACWPAAEWDAGKSAGIFAGSDGEGVYDAYGYALRCEADRRDSNAAERSDGLTGRPHTLGSRCGVPGSVAGRFSGGRSRGWSPWSSWSQ